MNGVPARLGPEQVHMDELSGLHLLDIINQQHCNFDFASLRCFAYQPSSSMSLP
jgi:hypothetical protein